MVVLAAVIGLGRWNISQYALTPGQATPVAPLVKISGVGTDTHRDRIMLTDVYLQNLTALQWLTLHLQSHVEFIPADALTSPGVPADELLAQGYLEMSDSKRAAEVAAFHALGWTTPTSFTGAVVTSVNVPSAARAAGINVADEIVSINGVAVDSTCSLIKKVHALMPGTVVHVGVAHAKISASGVITIGVPRTRTITTMAIPNYLSGPSSCAGVTGRSRSWFGVAVKDGLHFALPATVSIDTSNIGGPSAGLAMALTLIDQLSRGSLTGHHVVAATGTIDVHGAVGDVGGVAEKTVAAQRAGATYFLVPQIEVATARAAASPGLKVIGVTSLAQALHDLRAIGGDAPRPFTTPH